MTLKLLITAAVGLAVYLALQTVSTLSPGDVRSHVIWACEATGVAFGLWLLVSWPLRRANAGVLLQHVPDHMSRLAAILALISSVIILYLWRIDGFPYHPLESLAVPLAIVMALAAIQELRFGATMTEHGVLRFHGFTRHGATRADPIGLLVLGALFSVVIVAHAWVAPGGDRVADGVVIQFISDDEYGQPKIVFVRVPEDGLRAVVENRGGDGTVAHIGAVDLGPVQVGDQLEVRWGPNGDRTNQENAFHVALAYDNQIRIYTMPRPFPPDGPVVLPTVHHPIDQDGAIVVAYSLAEQASGRFDDLRGMDMPHRLTVKFERSR